MSARFAPGGDDIVYSAAWDGRPTELFSGRLGSPEARSLGLEDTRALSISRAGEMALLLRGPWSLFLGTLAQAPLAGGAPRELLQNVSDADWIADSGQLAVVRWEDPRSVIEFPLGNKVHESPSVSFMRVSPRGDKVAFCQTAPGRPGQGDVVVVDRAGKRTLLSSGWVGLFGLAWSPSGEEVWFTATRPSLEEGPPALRAVSLSGKERLVARVPSWLLVNEVFRDGRVLLSSNLSRAGVRCLLRGDAGEREMGWLDSSFVQDMSPDGGTLLFGEGAGVGGKSYNGVFAQGVAGGAPRGAVYIRRTDGSPAVRLGEGYPADLSPDGKWVLVSSADGKELTLLPTGPGMSKRLPLGELTSVHVGQWLDDRHILFSGFEPGRPGRGFVKDLEDGSVRAVTPEGAWPWWSGPPSPDGKSVLAQSQDGLQLYPLDGGAPRPLPFPEPGWPAGWGADGRSLYVTDASDMQTRLNVYRQDIASGRRELWRTLAPPDPAGLEAVGPVVVTPDGGAYCYTYVRTLGTIYVVEGLK
jgi:Tol biopolymer transport system component